MTRPGVEPIDPPDDSALVHMDLKHVDDNALSSDIAAVTSLLTT